MRITLTLILCFSFLFSCAQNEIAQTNNEATSDGRFGTPCHKLDYEFQVCVVTVTKLAVNPERYHNKHVMLSGEITLEFENQRIADGVHSIRLDVTEQQIKDYKNRTNRAGVVVGIFDGHRAGLGYGDGTIHSIKELR